ncbi:MAG TPA: hypothetical protein VEJ67_07015 [Candidatus Cybelea sp.]|nr:hypothetical protein [Candidatus Cybelea sp.]
MKPTSKFVLVLGLTGLLLTPCAFPQQSSSGSGALLHARIKCVSEPEVTVTADPEQALPLQVVATLACNSLVTVVSDLGGYTVRVVTADSKVGYVARHELAILPAANTAGSGGPPAPPRQLSPPGQPKSASGEKPTSQPRVFITDSESWAEMSGFGNSASTVPGYNPEMGEIYQDFTSNCPTLTFVQDKSDADYAVLFDRGTPKKGITGLGGLVKVNKVTVLGRNGETVLSDSSRSEDAVVRLACHAITEKSVPADRGQPAATQQH